MIEARNQNEAKIAMLIEDFEAKIRTFFEYIGTQKEGQRLVVNIQSNAPENDIYDLFAIVYRRYSILKKKEVGKYFFKETRDLVNKLCDDFEKTIREA